LACQDSADFSEWRASTAPLAGGVSSDSDSRQPLELGTALQGVRANLPKWRATLSAMNVESLPIQYKTGKQVELLKSAALEQFDGIDKTNQRTALQFQTASSRPQKEILSIM
jgi:hypothetical protein